MTTAAIGRKSKTKGKRGELEFCHWLSEWCHPNGVRVFARRTQQWNGDIEGDIHTSIEWAHFEVTRSESMGVGTSALRAKLEQSTIDADPEQIPVVAWRRNRHKWMITFSTGANKLVPATSSADDWMASHGFTRSDV